MDASGPAGVPGAVPRAAAQRLRAARAKRGDGSEPSTRERALEKGGRGEQQFGLDLSAAACRHGGFGILHSLVTPGALGDIDHVVVGPAGVTVIDAKTWSGDASIRNGSLRLGSRNKRSELLKIQAQVERVRQVMREEGRADVPVSGAMAMVLGNRGISRVSVDYVEGVAVASSDPVIEHATRPGPLGLDDMLAVQDLLARRFEVRGGRISASAPTYSPRPSLTIPPAAPARPRRHHASSRLSPRILQAALGCMALVAAGIIGISILQSTADGLERMTRSELASHAAEYRALAVRRAHGRVHGPRVRSSFSEFRLVYRRKRCVVAIIVSRQAQLLGRPAPAVHSVGCRR